MQSLRTSLATLLVIVALVLAWQAAVLAFAMPAYLVPSPVVVWSAFLKSGPMVLRQVAATGLSACGGLVCGSIAAILLAIAMHSSRLLERLLMPILVVDQSIPKIAVAPLVIIWFGAGVASRIAIAVVVSFFPMIVGTLRGLRSADRRLAQLMHTLSASRLDELLKVRLPSALPFMLSALKIAAPLSVTGAIVAEYIQANSGLGYMIMLALTQFDTPLIFVAVVAAALLCLGLYGLCALIPQIMFGRRFGVLVQAHSRQ